jgi:hypothetical protein
MNYQTIVWILDNSNPQLQYQIDVYCYDVGTHLDAQNIDVILLNPSGNIIASGRSDINGNVPLIILNAINTPNGVYTLKAINGSDYNNATTYSSNQFTIPLNLFNYRYHANLGIIKNANANVALITVSTLEKGTNMYPIQNIEVTIKFSNNTIVFSKLTNKNGIVQTNLALGEYIIYINGMGVYQDKIFTASITTPDAYTFTAFLSYIYVPPTPTPDPYATPTTAPTPTNAPIVPPGTDIGGWWNNILEQFGLKDPTVKATVTGLFVILICAAIMGTAAGEVKVGGITTAYLVMVGAGIGLIANCIAGIWPLWILFIIFCIAVAVLAWKFGSGSEG